LQLYEIAGDGVQAMRQHVEEFGRIAHVRRFLKPYFSLNGTYAYMIRFDRRNVGISNEKAYPQVIRIHLDVSVSDSICSIMLIDVDSSSHRLIEDHR
jgi:hypothetical protein